MAIELINDIFKNTESFDIKIPEFNTLCRRSTYKDLNFSSLKIKSENANIGFYFSKYAEKHSSFISDNNYGGINYRFYHDYRNTTFFYNDNLYMINASPDDRFTHSLINPVLNVMYTILEKLENKEGSITVTLFNLSDIYDIDILNSIKYLTRGV